MKKIPKTLWKTQIEEVWVSLLYTVHVQTQVSARKLTHAQVENPNNIEG